LPLAGLIKKRFPDSTITFLGRSYTEAIVSLSRHVDQFINWNNFEHLPLNEKANKLKSLHADWILHVFPNKQIARAAKKAAIPFRVGTSHRTYHWYTCNRLVSFSRRKSELHEAQLNCKLLKPLSITVPEFEDIRNYFGYNSSITATRKIIDLIDNKKINVVLHPKSKGSAREWGLDNFQNLIDLLPKERYKIFITGTLKEAEFMKDFIEKNRNTVTDTTGKFDLTEFIAFLSLADCIVAASTGPLHVASVLGKYTIGIYPPILPMHSGRWAPIGNNSHVLEKQVNCNDCRRDGNCHCMKEIEAFEVKRILDEFQKLASDS
jgi:heptosyltransferase III